MSTAKAIVVDRRPSLVATMESAATASSRVPLEIVTLILKVLEHDKDALRNCSLTCNAWHDLCLPYIFKTVNIRGDTDYTRAFRCFMITSPHLRPHVRRTALYITEPDARDQFHFWTTSGWFDEEHTKSLISSFPNLNYVDCSSFPLSAISFALPQLPITTLHLQKYSVTTDEFLDVLAAGAQTLRSLTVMFIDCHPSSSPPTESIPTIMSALKELSASCSMNLPFVPERVQMPSLQTLFSDIDDFEALSICLPDSLKTLVIHTVEEAQSRSKILHVENLCLISDDYWDGLPSCIDTIDTFISPSSIKHLELVLHRYMHSREPDVEFLDAFEEFLLNLHETGSFERLTLTFPGDPTEQRAYEAYEHFFPSLRLLGLLDEIRMGSSPISLSSMQR